MLFQNFSSKRKHQRKLWFFSSNSNMEFLSSWKNLNLYAFIRWAGVDPDSYLKERKKRIETKKKGSKVDNKNSFKRQATVIFIKFLIDSKWM